MTTKGLTALALAAVLGLNPIARADDEKMPDAKAFDKAVVDTLRAVHNTGADLYNEGKDFPGAYRMYQGALMTVRPLLAHHPEAQKLIDVGFADADKEADAARKAFVLHVAIEAVRKHLKTAPAEPTPVEPPPVTKPDPPKKPVEPPVKKPEPPKKPKPSGLPVAPPPHKVKTK